MLTQCPECRTVFRAMAQHLQAAGGRVRCGQCGAVFDALEESGQAGDEHPVIIPSGPDPGFGPETEVQFEFDEPESDPLADTAEHEILDVEVESTPSIEITMEGERIAIDGEAFEELEYLEEDGEELAAQPEPDREREPHAEPVRASDSEREFVLPSGTRVTFGEQSEPSSLPPPLEPVRPHTRRWLWGAGVAALLLALAAQLTHHFRDSLAGHPWLGEPLTRAYARFGVHLEPVWDVHAYEVRQWGATADPQNTGTLRIQASLINHAERAQPYPLLRLVLRDRFGNEVAARDLGPADYLPAAPDGLLGAGQRVDARIAVVDPGSEAVGFEMDACLRRRHGLICANDARP